MSTILRWGLIGCGDIARKRVAPALRDSDGSELYSVARAQAELAAEFAKEFGATKHHADWRNLLADPEVDAVYIATPVDLHAEQTIAAAAAGKHVLCEKPIAIRACYGEAMARACASAAVKFGIAYYRRFYPAVQRVKELLTDGTIGEPVLLQIDAFEQFNPAPGGDRSWLIDPARSGGGPMMDFGSHRIELLLDWFGEPVDVTSYADSVLLKRDAEDTSSVQMRFASGVRGEVTVSHAVFGFRDSLEVFGSGGSLHIPSLNGGDITIRTAEGERTEAHPPHANVHQPLVEDFVAAVRDNRSPSIGADRAVAVQRVLDKIYGR